MSTFYPLDTKHDLEVEAALSRRASASRSVRRRVAYGALALWLLHATYIVTTSTATLNNSQGASLTSQVSAHASEWKDWVKWHCHPLPKDPKERALAILSRYPIIDGHIDTPIQARVRNANHIDQIDLHKGYPGHVDIPRLREGKVGGFFWSAYTPCPADGGYGEGDIVNFTTPFNAVRDTLEQIDIARLIIDKHSDSFDLSASSWDWRRAIHHKKIGGMIGIEGGHQLGNSLATIRTYYALGARYLTLTHTCNNALADSCGYPGSPVKPRWGGLSSFGRAAIKELNRVGMLVDLSHTHPDTASQALSLSLAPPIFSHSNARGVHDHVRNVPDAILRRIGRLDSQEPFDLSKDGEAGKGYGADTGEVDKIIPSGDSIVMVNYSPDFVSENGKHHGQRANISLLADHVDYIGRLAGRRHVGVGSDLDGIGRTPVGLEDASKYPDLVAELIRRGWTDREVAGFASGNLLRILARAERVAGALQTQGAPVGTEIFEGREDIGERAKHPW